MRLSGFEQLGTDRGQRLIGRVETASGEPLPIIFEIEPALEGPALDRADAFVLVALLMAVLAGEDLDIEAPISERLARSLADAAAVLAYLFAANRRPKLRFGPLKGRHAVHPRGLLTGLSGGVDSSLVIKQHHFEVAAPLRPITHLVFSDLGQRFREGWHEGSRAVFEFRRARMATFADELGLPLYQVYTNFHERVDDATGINHTLRSAAIAHLFGQVCSDFVYGSGTSYPFITLRPGEDMGFTDPITLPLFSSDLLECIPSGSAYRRVDKTAELVDMDFFKRYVDVCWRHELPGPGAPINCGHCPKCLRTLMALEVLGKLDDFADAFVMERYWAARDRAYLLHILETPDDQYFIEMQAFAAERGYDLGLERIRRAHWRDPMTYARMMPAEVKRPIKRLIGRPD